MKQDLKKYQNDFILLCEAGFIAVNQMDEDAATKLFKASLLLKPENCLPKVGLGYMYLMQLKVKEAMTMFNEVIAKEPDNEMAKTFLGLTCTFTANELAKGETMLEESAKTATDPSIKELATNALQFVDKFVKKGSAAMPPPPSSKPKSPEKNR